MKLIKRRQWNAMEPKKYYYNHFPTVITLHDSHRLSNYKNFKFQPRFHGSKTMREIQIEHIQSGMIDIGYHYVIDFNGDIYEGRPIDVEGCHVKFKDKGNIGIVLVGNFDVENPSREQVNSLLELMQYINSIFNYMDIPDCITVHKPNKNEGYHCGGELLHTILKYVKVKVKEGKENGI